MNLVDKYIEVIKATKGYEYDRDVLDYLNRTLGSEYVKQTLYNWRAPSNPRPVPREVKAHMRETVVIYMLGELEPALKAQPLRKLAHVLNDERKMRQQILDTTFDTSGASISPRRRKTITESLETLYDLQA